VIRDLLLQRIQALEAITPQPRDPTGGHVDQVDLPGVILGCGLTTGEVSTLGRVLPTSALFLATWAKTRCRVLPSCGAARP
jgi:hypothetical protein